MKRVEENLNGKARRKYPKGNTLLKYLSLFLVIGLLIQFSAPEASASYTDKRVNVKRTFVSDSCDACHSRHYVDYVTIAHLPANSALVSISGEVTLTRSNGVPSPRVEIAGSTITDYGGGSGRKTWKSISTPTNTTVPFNITLDPSQTISTPYVFFKTGTSYQDFTVYIDSYTYRTFNTASLVPDISLTPEKYVRINAKSNGLFDYRLTITNTTDNRDLVNNLTTKSSRQYIDSQVLPGKTYEYIVDYYINTVSPRRTHRISILVPDAATEAKIAAEAAKAAAEAANNTMNTIISPKLTLVEGAVRDSSGNTALSMARLASQNASNAKTSADTAAANALMAANRTQQVIDQTWESSENKSAATLSKEARDRASEAVETINEVSSNLDEKIDTLQNNVTNIQNFIAPSLMKVSGFRNATATRSNNFNVMLDYSGANEYRYKLNNGGWSSWSSLSSHDSNGYVSIGGVSTTGHHTATIEIRYNGGDVQSPVARGSISFFKL